VHWRGPGEAQVVTWTLTEWSLGLNLSYTTPNNQCHYQLCSTTAVKTILCSLAASRVKLVDWALPFKCDLRKKFYVLNTWTYPSYDHPLQKRQVTSYSRIGRQRKNNFRTRLAPQMKVLDFSLSAASFLKMQSRPRCRSKQSSCRNQGPGSWVSCKTSGPGRPAGSHNSLNGGNLFLTFSLSL
jgi:hypothetical protein